MDSALLGFFLESSPLSNRGYGAYNKGLRMATALVKSKKASKVPLVMNVAPLIIETACFWFGDFV